jgi:uncharacterized protein
MLGGLETTTIALIALILVLAGFIKGVIGFGLPAISMGLLSLMMSPAQAAALLVVPNIISNLQQALVGPGSENSGRSFWQSRPAACFGIGSASGKVRRLQFASWARR